MDVIAVFICCFPDLCPLDGCFSADGQQVAKRWDQCAELLLPGVRSLQGYNQALRACQQSGVYWHSYPDDSSAQFKIPPAKAQTVLIGLAGW